MNVANSVTLYYYSLRGDSLYKCEFWQAAKCSCMTVSWAETYDISEFIPGVMFVKQGE